MAVDFPSNAIAPSYGSSPQVEFRIISATFGDGYTQRTADGLNTKIETWELTWNVLTTAEKNVITDFLDARGGYEAINYTMPSDSVSKKWTCAKYKPTPIQPNFYSLTATFERVYDV